MTVATPQMALAEILDDVAGARHAVAERSPFADRLKELARSLDLLADDLARQDGAGLRHRAQSAYGSKDGG
jgi:hypothetical protein